MLKKRSIRKILISTSVLFAAFLIYIIPSENKNKQVSIKQEIEYVDKTVKTHPVFLLNSKNMISRAVVYVSSENVTVEKRVKELIELLITSGPLENRIPSGFRAIIPSDTKINNIHFENNLLKLDLSKELIDVEQDKEIKVIEALVYTLTTIEEIKDIILYVDGDILTKLPKSGYNLPSTLNRKIGINKEYLLTSTKDINSITVYYIDKHNEDYYYVPVTKYANDSREKIHVIIEDLATRSIYQTNLMSFLNSNTKLLETQLTSDIMELKFNEYIFADMEEKKILEEVIYTIGLSINDNYDVKELVIAVHDEQIYKTVLKEIE